MDGGNQKVENIPWLEIDRFLGPLLSFVEGKQCIGKLSKWTKWLTSDGIQNETRQKDARQNEQESLAISPRNQYYYNENYGTELETKKVEEKKWS